MTEIQVINKLEGKLWIWSQSICLAPPGEVKHDDLWPIFDDTLKRLRFVSGQFEIPRILVALTPHVLSPSESARDWSSFVGSPEAHVRKYLLESALTHDHLRRLAELPADFSTPVHADVLLDALEATYAQDSRKALLYAAIAMEAFARQQIENEMADIKIHRTPQHRVVVLPLSGGDVAVKDPVFEILAGLDSLPRVLHEQALYVLGRSLLIDDEGLYSRALRLCRTRNKIAHLGSAPAEENYYPMTRKGALEGVATAIAVMKWFGDTIDYPIDGDLHLYRGAG
jgi:hypothetical protein